MTIKNPLLRFLYYGTPMTVIPAYGALKRSDKFMDERYEPLELRLMKTNPSENIKLSSDCSSFSKYREKIAVGLTAIQQLVPSLVAGTALAEGIGSLGSGIGQTVKPISDVIGYKLYKKLFPGASGMVAYTRAPEKALEQTATAVGKELGSTISGGIRSLIDNMVGANNEIVNASPRRKMILAQLRREDDLVKQLHVQKALEAYHSMVEVAPTLSLDKNAVKSFLRGVASSPDGGLDWNTMKGLADAEVSIKKSKGII